MLSGDKVNNPLLVEESKESSAGIVSKEADEDGRALFQIEKCGLSEQHCLVQYYKETSYYTIKDLSYQYPSVPGDDGQ